MGNAPTPKPWIEAIHAYVPGKSVGSDGRPLVKLSANENPLGTSAKALAARGEVRDPSLYPDPDSKDLREAIAALHGLDPALVVMGTGSDELLNLAAQGYAGCGDEIVFSRYSFAVYDIAARRCGASPVEVRDSGYGADVDALLAAVTDRTRVMFVANPNNPTGTFLPGGEIARLHAGLPGDVLLVLDQAYAEYLDPADDDAGIELARTHPNVLVTRTFSKIYGLAGERIGWATGSAALVDTLNRIRGPFNVTNSGQAMALAAVGDQSFVEASREHNRAQRTRFVEAISALGNHGLRVVPSEANFVLVLFEGKLSAEAAYDGLVKRGTIVRWLPNQGLGHALRITIGTAGQMDAIALALRQMAEAV
ncbi:MAG: histidinol-phosphate transaminase [Sphingomonadales bacterium]|nr:histidinol-phosphate transaminase [Sphingomonadales bacterium]